MDLRTDVVTQHELLIRMKGQDGEIVLPGRFLPAAEEFGLILNIDRWVVEQSALLASTGHKVEFNISAKSMGLGMVGTIAEALRVTGEPPENLMCELPVSYLKIDMQFVADLVTEPSSRHVVRAIVDLAHGFGAETVAEGAEDGETVELLKTLDVDFVQGYHIARPGPVDEMLSRNP